MTGTLSACTWTSSDQTTPEPTPSDIPDEPSEEPTPEPTPDMTETPSAESTPVPTPSPIPESVEQVLRIAGELPDADRYALPPDATCSGISSVISGLLRVNDEFGLEADWAESWQSDDGETWVFQIRENEAGWTGGMPVTAHDFVKAWQWVLDPEAGSSEAWRLFDIQNAREIAAGDLPPGDLGAVAVNDWTLEVTLDRPRYSFPALSAAPMLAPFAGPAEGDGPGGGCHANGPYLIESTDEQRTVLVPHPGYWRAAATWLERIEVTEMRPAEALNDFRQSNLDFFRVPPSDLVRVRNDANVRPELYPGVPTRIICLIPQADTPPFDDPAVRRALSMVIDRTRLETIVEGRVVPATRLVPDGMFGSSTESGDDMDARLDIDAAYAELENSDSPDPEDWPEIEVAIPGEDTYMARLARDVAAQLEENLGVTMTVETLEREEYENALRENRFGLTWLDWTYRYADAACAYGDLFASWLNPDRPIAWQDEAYDDLVRAADTVENRDDRAEIYAQCEQFLQQEGIYVPLVHPVEYFLVQSWVNEVPRDSRGRLVQPGPVFTRFTSGLFITERT